MGVRLLNDVQSVNVVLFPARAWRTEADTPEPAQLYHLILLAFQVHTPGGEPEVCTRCDHAWLCDHLRLAFRLREGF